MKSILRPLALLLVLGLVACSQKSFNSNLQVEPKPVPGIDWSQYKTWSYGRQGEYVHTGIETLDDPRFRKAVTDHVIDEMAKIGYEHVNGNPDMLIMFHVLVEDRYDEAKLNPAYKDFDMQWAQEGKDDTWTEGTLMMFALDAKTGAQIWSSTARAELAKDANFETKKKRFNQATTELIKDFPVRSTQ